MTTSETIGFNGACSCPPPAATPFIDAVVEQVANAARARLEETRARAGRLHEVVERYVATVEHNVASDLAHKNDVEYESASSPIVATEIRELVDALLSICSPQPLSTSDAGCTAPAAPPTAVATLAAEIDAACSRSQDDRRLLKLHIQEFAARARILQDAGVASSEVVQLNGIFGRLSRLCRERNISGVIGLRRDHHGDWAALAKAAVAGRNAPCTPQPLTHRIAIPAGLRDAIAAGPGSAIEPSPVSRLVPLLAAASSEAPVQIVGGQAHPERLLHLTSRTGVQVEWVALDDHEERALDSLVGRIERGCTAGLVLLNGLMGHRGYGRIIEAARRAGLPTAYAERGGVGRIERAFEQLEAALRQQSGESVACQVAL
jgi:hypothetical protein